MSWITLAGTIAAAHTAIAGTAQEPPSAVPIEELAEAAPAPELKPEFTAAEIFALQTERYRRLTVPITIGGEGPFNFMIDTGAQATVLARDLADQLELFDRQTATLVAMASERQVETTVVERFALGSREFTVASAPILESSNIGGADGILGIDTLQDQRVLFDFENSLLAVADADELGGNRGFDIIIRARQRLGQLIVSQAEIDGVSVSVIVDTGAQGSVGNRALQRRLRRSRDSAEATMTDVNGVQLTGESKFARRLEIGRANLNNFAITFTDSPTFAALGLEDRPAMVLGMSELRVFKRVAIDFKSRRVLLDLPDDVHLSATDLFR